MAKDIYHQSVRDALEYDGWRISHDPLTIKLTKRKVFIDLGAERLIAAERGEEKIAIEIKSFIGLSLLTDFYKALGQYQLYVLGLKKRFPNRKLFLAMPEESYLTLLNDDILAEFLNELSLNLIIFDPNTSRIVQWIK
jgi:XisH protein